MTTKTLDIIIFSSIVGIVTILSIKSFIGLTGKTSLQTNNSQYSYQNYLPQTSPVINAATNFKTIDCNSKYFSPIIGSKRTYQLTIRSNEKAKLKSTSIDFITTVISATGSAITLSTEVKDKKSSQTKLICTDKGIIGLPFSTDLLLKQVGANQSILKNFAENDFDYALIPSDNKLIINNSWTEKIAVIAEFLELQLINKVTSQRNITYPGAGSKSTFTVNTTIQLPNLPGISNNKMNAVLFTQIATELGITRLDLSLNKISQASLKLTRYQE